MKRTVPIFSIDFFRFILAIFVSFFILFQRNSSFFTNFREVRKVRARNVPELQQ
jgi:hypothetical protein